jgi:hypothetical protein
MFMKLLLPFLLSLTLVVAVSPKLSALDQDKAAYAGGTVALFNEGHGRVEGRLDLSDPQALVFVGNGPQGQRVLRIEYSSIHDVEFGQKVRRRVAAATASTAVLGPLGALAFTLKKREHYLTVVYSDHRGLDQVVILQLGKNVVRSTLLTVEARSGIVVESQDTVAIEDGEDVDVIVRWSGHRGRYVLHCHNLEHEDHSMMARVDVG